MNEEAEHSSALESLVAGLADNKYFLGRRYAEWCTGAPALEAAVAAAAMAQDEIGHARSLYPLLRDITGETPESEPETRTSFTNAAFLSEPFDSWTDFVAANFLFDTALSVLISAAADSSSTGLGQRARRILDEEQLHWLHGEGWTKRLGNHEEPVRVALMTSMDRVGPDALTLFELARDSLIVDAVLAEGTEQLQDRFRRRVNPVLQTQRLPSL